MGVHRRARSELAVAGTPCLELSPPSRTASLNRFFAFFLRHHIVARLVVVKEFQLLSIGISLAQLE